MTYAGYLKGHLHALEMTLARVKDNHALFNK